VLCWRSFAEQKPDHLFSILYVEVVLILTLQCLLEWQQRWLPKRCRNFAAEFAVRHATDDLSLHAARSTCQTTIALAVLRRMRRRVLGFPSPHHASGSLASEEMSSHLVVQAREKDSIHHVAKAGAAARIGAIERNWPGFPAKPNHGAPFRPDRVLFGYEHGNSSIHAASTNASAGSPPSWRTLSEVKRGMTFRLCASVIHSSSPINHADATDS
jgi:hypothetical protein